MNITLEHVSKRFFSLRGSVPVLDDVGLAVRAGEFFVLLGPSGCGKSTLLNLIAGLERPTGGKLMFGGKTVADAEEGIFVQPGKRNVAMVFQSYALYPNMSVRRNIAFPLEIAGEKKEAVAESVAEAARLLSIGELLDALPAELSGGQRQRVAIARAIVRKPALFLLDEPLSNLDAKLRGAMRRELKALQRRLGITTIYVTHDQVEAMTLGDRVAVIQDGRIAQIGTPAALYADPANPFIASFLGNPPMNLLKGELAAEGADRKLICGGAKLGTDSGLRLKVEAAYLGPVLAGVRPEDVTISSGSDPAGMRAKVLSLESIGREKLVYAQSSSGTVVFFSAGLELIEGAEIELRLKKVHVFACGGGLPERMAPQGRTQ